MNHFEQFIDTKTDTVIYGFNKITKLLLSCNPNTIEMLGTKPEHIFYMNDIGKLLRDNAKLFLSQRAIGSFGGYAGQQLNRMLNALARDRLDQKKKKSIFFVLLKVLWVPLMKDMQMFLTEKLICLLEKAIKKE